jgi:hypothetical protein
VPARPAGLDDILLSDETSFHVFRLLPDDAGTPAAVVHLVLDRDRTNLSLARRELGTAAVRIGTWSSPAPPPDDRTIEPDEPTEREFADEADGADGADEADGPAGLGIEIGDELGSAAEYPPAESFWQFDPRPGPDDRDFPPLVANGTPLDDPTEEHPSPDPDDHYGLTGDGPDGDGRDAALAATPNGLPTRRPNATWPGGRPADADPALAETTRPDFGGVHWNGPSPDLSMMERVKNGLRRLD